MKLNRQEKEIVRRKFCTYCIKVLHGEALNYLDELDRQREREVIFSEEVHRKLHGLPMMICLVVQLHWKMSGKLR